MEEKKYIAIEQKLVDLLCDYCQSDTDTIMDIIEALDSDHKAVVETKDKTIAMYEDEMGESNRFAQLLMSEEKEMQNKIEELEKTLSFTRETVDFLENKIKEITKGIK